MLKRILCYMLSIVIFVSVIPLHYSFAAVVEESLEQQLIVTN